MKRMKYETNVDAYELSPKTLHIHQSRADENTPKSDASYLQTRVRTVLHVSILSACQHSLCTLSFHTLHPLQTNSVLEKECLKPPQNYFLKNVRYDVTFGCCAFEALGRHRVMSHSVGRQRKLNSSASNAKVD